MTIDGGRIIATPLLRYDQDPGDAYDAYCRAVATNTAMGDMALQIDLPKMTVVVNGVRRKCPITLLDVRGRGLMIAIPYGSETLYVLACEGGPSEPWQNATKVLLLPTITPTRWGVGRNAQDQRHGRVLMYAAAAVMDGWFE